jgi:hypothetical protein
VSVVELVIAGLCGAAGVRSLVLALRRPFEPVDARDRVLYALYLTARTGWWVTLGFFFLAYALVEEPQDLRWFLLVPIALAGLQLLSGLGLAHGEDRRPGGSSAPELNGQEPPEEPS